MERLAIAIVIELIVAACEEEERRRSHVKTTAMGYKQTNKSSYSFIHSFIRTNKYSSEASFISFSYVLFSEVSLRYSKSIT